MIAWRIKGNQPAMHEKATALIEEDYSTQTTALLLRAVLSKQHQDTQANVSLKCK